MYPSRPGRKRDRTIRNTRAAHSVEASSRCAYVTSGNDYSSPATPNSDAVLALDMADGAIVWSKQMTAGDAYNSSCGGDRLNCPNEAGPDFDFASSAILVV